MQTFDPAASLPARLLEAAGRDDGGIKPLRVLAREMGVDERLLHTVAEGLLQRGYLAAAAGCGEEQAAACGGCSLAAACSPAGDGSAPGSTCATGGAKALPRFLVVTDKGRRAAGKNG